MMQFGRASPRGDQRGFRSLSGFDRCLDAVRMATDTGQIVLDRADGSLATLSIQGQPDRAVALKRRETAELIAEELRRLDPDDTYASALRFGVDRLNPSLPAPDLSEAVAPKGEEVAVEAAEEAAAPEAEAEPKAEAPVKDAARNKATKAAAK